MIRLAAIAILGALAATPAAAACQTVPDLVASFRAALPARAVVREISASSAPAVAAWLESEGYPGGGATRFLQVVGDSGIGLVPIPADGRVCDGAVAIELVGEPANALIALVRRLQQMRGTGPEYEA